MNFRIVLILLLSVGLLNSCLQILNNELNHRDNEISLEEVILDEFKNGFPDEHSILEIGREISRDSSSYRFVINDSVGEKNSIEIGLIKQPYLNEDLRYVNMDCFEICLNDCSIFINGLKGDLTLLTINLENFYKQVYNSNLTKGSKIDSIPFFGKVLIPRIIVNIGIDSKSNHFNKEEWLTFAKCIDTVYRTIQVERNELAIDVFGVSFEDLSIEKKKAILVYKPIEIVLYFDMIYCSKPIFPEEFEVVDSIF